MKNCILISCIGIVYLIVFSNPVFAQEIQSDYVILSSGQKISGEILRDFDYSQYNNNSITFISPQGEKRTFTPENIQGFGFSNGRIFNSRNLPGVEGKVFSREIFTGSLSLIGFRERFFLAGEYEINELKAGFEVAEKEGLYLKVFKKPYLETLSLMLAGVCGSQLTRELNRTLFTEQSFIDLLSKYHECEGIDYAVNVERIKIVRISPFLGGGYMNVQTVVNNRSEGRKDVLGQSGTSFFLAGVKVYQFRNLPKLGFDLGLGYATIENQINTEYISPEVTYTATEDFTLSSIVVPVFLNYSVFKNQSIETYLGVGGTYSRNKLDSSRAFRDLTTNYNASS